MMNSRINKRGGFGSFIVMFFATIAIIIILLIFAYGSGLIREFKKLDDGVYDEKDVSVYDVYYYMIDYRELAKAKYLIAKGSELDDALRESGYEK